MSVSCTRKANFGIMTGKQHKNDFGQNMLFVSTRASFWSFRARVFDGFCIHFGSIFDQQIDFETCKMSVSCTRNADFHKIVFFLSSLDDVDFDTPLYQNQHFSRCLASKIESDVWWIFDGFLNPIFSVEWRNEYVYNNYYTLMCWCRTSTEQIGINLCYDRTTTERICLQHQWW